MRSRIIKQTRQCVDKCPDGFKFFDDYSCVFRCPVGSIPDNFICKYNFVLDKDDKTCSIRNFFLGNCKMELTTYRQNQKFIDKVMNQIVNGELYDLVINAIDRKYNYTLRNGNETYQIYPLANNFRDPDLVYIDMEECGKVLRQKYSMRESDDIIVFKIEYNSPDFKIPIVEYSLFGLFGTEKLSLSSCENIKMRYFIPKKIDNYQDYKYNPNNAYYINKCHSYTSDNNTDIILLDRMDQYNKNNMSLCESICTLKDM